MAIWKKLLSNTRLRSLFILLGVFLGVVVIVVFYQYTHTTLLGVSGSASVANLSPTTGSSSEVPKTQKMSPEYLNALLQSQKITTQTALQKGRTSVGDFITTGEVAVDQTAPTQTVQPCNPCEQGKAADGLVDQLSQQGAIMPETAAELKKMQDANMSVSAYAAELNKLVSEGKLTPDQAKQLLAAYKKQNVAVTQQKAEDDAVAADDLANQMVATGEMVPNVASQLQELSKKGMSISDYNAALGNLVKQGKLTADQAQHLKDAYVKQHGVSTSFSSKTTAAEKAQSKTVQAHTSDALAQMQRSGGVSADTAKTLQDFDDQEMPAATYAARLNDLVKSGQLTPDQAQQLLSAYRAEHDDTNVTGSDEVSQATKQQQEQALQQQMQELQRAQTAAAQQTATQKAQQTQQEVQALQAAMSTQAQQLYSSWGTTNQTYQYTGKLSDQSSSDGSSSVTSPNGQTSASDKNSQKKDAGSQPLVKAGDITFGVLETAVDSDYPGPIMASIVSGPLKGAKLIGSIKTVTVQGTSGPQRLTLNFTQLTMKDWPDVVTIDAVAINPDTAYTALASNVNNHYLSRYGSLFAASFLEGYSSALTSSGSAVVSNAGVTTQTTPSLSAGGRLMVALGQVGQSLSGVVGNYMTRPPTVKIDAGVGIGVLFTTTVAKPGFE